MVKQKYSEGIMELWSQGVGSGTAPGGVVPTSKGDPWGDSWAKPFTQDDSWGMEDYNN